MPVIRVLLGLGSLVAAALLLNAAFQRLMSGLALLFGGALALATGGLLVGSAIWSLARRLRRKRGAAAAQRVAPEDAPAFD